MKKSTLFSENDRHTEEQNKARLAVGLQIIKPAKKRHCLMCSREFLSFNESRKCGSCRTHSMNDQHGADSYSLPSSFKNSRDEG